MASPTIHTDVSQRVQDVVYSMQYFSPISSRDPNTREQALNNLSDLMEQYLEGYGSPLQDSSSGFLQGIDRGSLLQSMLPGFLRLSLDCPLSDVRERFTTFLEQVKERGHKLKMPQAVISGPCTFIPGNEIVQASTTNDETNSIFLDAFFQNNRLEHASQVMGYHPDYLRTFLATQNFLLREDGPLPYEYRHYIAILAAARHHCSYIVKLHEQEFLLHNGNPDWLKGIEHAPSKLKDLYEINKILAHRPWLITKQHIANLLKGSEPWSLSELMHAIIILTHFHSLCSFIYGCGINPELDLDGFSYQRFSSASDDSSDSGDGVDSHHHNHKSHPQQHQHLHQPAHQRISNCDSHDISRDDASLGVEELMEKMRRLTENSSQLTDEEELIKRFKLVENQNAEITVPSNKKSSPKAEILRYVKESEFSYTDFDSRDTSGGNSIFQARDYSWDDHGFSLSNRLYSDVGNFLDNKFSTAYQLTYYTMGDKREVDTSSFRRAIWNHIHSMYGILHEDYDYSEVEQLLEFNLKAYMKTLTCYPERLQKKDYENVMREFKHSEKVHVNLMLMDARQQAELLYALRALNSYMT